jgi:hypothetical protein
LRLAPAICLALAACELPPEVPADAGSPADGFHWEDAAPVTDTGAGTDGGTSDAAGSDAGPNADGGADGGTTPLPYSIVVLPDTQYYSSTYPELFDAQTAWIVEQHAAGNVAFVLHEGDIVDDDVATQWSRAYNSLHMLDGVVPYVISAGNHDYCCGGWPGDRAMTMINGYFPVSTFSDRPSFKGTFEADHIENSAHLLDVPGSTSQWLVLSLEFGPRNAVLAWADGIAKQFADTPAIVLTHAYLYDDNTRYDHVARPTQLWNPHSYPLGANGGDANDGEEMWQKLVLGNSNIKFVLSGHVLNSGVGRLSSTRPDGTVCHQILANYQNYDRGGDGFLRVLRFFPDARVVHVQTYSPTFGSMTDDRNDFMLAY